MKRRHLTARLMCSSCTALSLPFNYRLSIFRESLELIQWRLHPITGFQDDSDCSCLLHQMTFQSPLHFNFDAVVESKKIRTDKKQDNVSGFQCSTDSLIKIVTG